MSKEFKTVTSINGKFVRRGADKISVFDNSLLYAEGLFETFLAIGEKPIFLKEHLSRLYSGAKVLGIKIPVGRDKLAEWIVAVSKKHPDRIKKIRLTVTAGEAARWVGTPGKQQVIISASPHTMPTELFKLHLSDLRVDQDSVFRRIKTLSYAIHAAALNSAKKSKCDDALLLNEKGEIAEVTSANIFWVKKRKLYTPPLSAGCLEGITRKIVIRESKKLGFKTIIKNGKLNDLYSADEVFISSSLKLVIGADYLKDGRKIKRFKVGEITREISDHFYKLVDLT